MITLFSHLRVPRSSSAIFYVCLALTTGVTQLGARSAPSDADMAKSAEFQLSSRGWALDSITIQGADVPGVRHLVASGRIAAPPRDVWAAVSCLPDPGDKWPSVKEIVVERVGLDMTIARYTMAVPVFPDRHYRLRSTANPAQMRLSFEMIPGYGNVHEIRGYWQVVSLGDSLSRVIYVLDADPGVRLVPRFIIDWATRHTAPRSFAFLRELARAHSRSSGASGRQGSPHSWKGMTQQ